MPTTARERELLRKVAVLCQKWQIPAGEAVPFAQGFDIGRRGAVDDVNGLMTELFRDEWKAFKHLLGTKAGQ